MVDRLVPERAIQEDAVRAEIVVVDGGVGVDDVLDGPVNDDLPPPVTPEDGATLTSFVSLVDTIPMIGGLSR